MKASSRLNGTGAPGRFAEINVILRNLNSNERFKKGHE